MFPLEMIVVWREITKHMEMSNEALSGVVECVVRHSKISDVSIGGALGLGPPYF